VVVVDGKHDVGSKSGAEQLRGSKMGMGNLPTMRRHKDKAAHPRGAAVTGGDWDWCLHCVVGVVTSGRSANWRIGAGLGTFLRFTNPPNFEIQKKGLPYVQKYTSLAWG
jgi:hypothetical protein